MPSLAAVPFDHLREQLPGAADEREALRIFIGARAFADEHQPRLFVARSEDDLVAALVQAAAFAIADVGEDLKQVILRGFEGRDETGTGTGGWCGWSAGTASARR